MKGVLGMRLMLRLAFIKMSKMIEEWKGKLYNIYNICKRREFNVFSNPTIWKNYRK